MSTLERSAHFQNRRDEVPNQELARDLAKPQRARVNKVINTAKSVDESRQIEPLEECERVKPL